MSIKHFISYARLDAKSFLSIYYGLRKTFYQERSAKRFQRRFGAPLTLASCTFCWEK